MGNAASFTALQTPFLDATGKVSWTWLKLLQQWQTQLGTGFDQAGNLTSNISPSVGITGRTGTLAGILTNIGDNGQVSPSGLPSATSSTQGAVIMPAGSANNTLGSAAVQPSTAFDSAGAAASAQTNAQNYADTAAAGALSAAKNFARDASNITGGTLSTDRLSGYSGTIVTAALTLAGTQGSMTFTNGLLESQVAAT